MRLTDTETCQKMNGLYEVMKGMSVGELKATRDLAQVEQTGEAMRLIVYCCGETIRRKNKGIWKCDPMREIVQLEERRTADWKSRAETAEAWHWEAAAILADVSRRFTLPESQMIEVRRLLAWEPK